MADPLLAEAKQDIRAHRDSAPALYSIALGLLAHMAELVERVERAERVVEAAQSYMAVPRRAKRNEDGVVVFDFKPQQDALAKLDEALAAHGQGSA